MTDYLVNFVNHLDPNGPTTLDWPKYHPSSAEMLEFLDGEIPQAITQDMYRKEAMDYTTKVASTHSKKVRLNCPSQVVISAR